jgi:hypothetical protein
MQTTLKIRLLVWIVCLSFLCLLLKDESLGVSAAKARSCSQTRQSTTTESQTTTIALLPDKRGGGKVIPLSIVCLPATAAIRTFLEGRGRGRLRHLPALL